MSSFSLTTKNMSSDQIAGRNDVLTKAQLVAHAVVSILIFFFSSTILINVNREAKLGIIADFRGLSIAKWMALISCVLALTVVALCLVMFAVGMIGEPSTVKRKLGASFEAKVLRVFQFTTSGTVLYGGLLAASIAQAALGLIMLQLTGSVPRYRTINGVTTTRTALKDSPVAVTVLGLVASAVSGFGMWYRSSLKDAYNSKYINPISRAVSGVGGLVGSGISGAKQVASGALGAASTVFKGAGALVGGTVGAGVSGVTKGYTAARDWFYNTPASSI